MMNKFRRTITAPTQPLWLEVHNALTQWQAPYGLDVTLHCRPETGELTVKLEGLYDFVWVRIDPTQPMPATLATLKQAATRLYQTDVKLWAQREPEETAMLAAEREFLAGIGLDAEDGGLTT